MEITQEKLKKWEEDFFKTPQNEVFMHAVCENGILKTAKKKDVKIALSNSFGFGGHNAVLMFEKV